MKKKYLTFLFAAVAMLLLSSCVATEQDVKSLDLRLSSVDNRLQVAENTLRDLQKQQSGTVQSLQVRQAEAGNQADQLNTELQQLKGQIEESSFQYKSLHQENDALRAKWQQTIDLVRKAYVDLADATTAYVQEKHPEMAPRDRRKWARQAARSILPNATETKIFVTANSRAWRHFLELRGSIHADTEIRMLAVEICRVLKQESPNIFHDIEVANEADGLPAVRVTHSKV